MVGDHYQPSAGAQHLEALFQRHFERFHFSVYFDAQGLEQLGQEFRFVLFRGTGRYGRNQVCGGQDRLRGPCADDAGGDFPGGVDFAPIAQDAGQGIGVERVHQVGRRASSALVHPHVERCRTPERESPFDGIEMVGRHAQVGQDTIDPGYSAQPQGAPHEAEVAFDVMEAAVFRAVVPGIPILIEGVKTSPVAQCRQDAARMSATAEGEIDIGSCRIDVEQSDGLFEQDGRMIDGGHLVSIYI